MGLLNRTRTRMVWMSQLCVHLDGRVGSSVSPVSILGQASAKLPAEVYAAPVGGVATVHGSGLPLIADACALAARWSSAPSLTSSQKRVVLPSGSVVSMHGPPPPGRGGGIGTQSCLSVATSSSAQVRTSFYALFSLEGSSHPRVVANIPADDFAHLLAERLIDGNAPTATQRDQKGLVRLASISRHMRHAGTCRRRPQAGRRGGEAARRDGSLRRRDIFRQRAEEDQIVGADDGDACAMWPSLCGARSLGGCPQAGLAVAGRPESVGPRQRATGNPRSAIWQNNVHGRLGGPGRRHAPTARCLIVYFLVCIGDVVRPLFCARSRKSSGPSSAL